MAPPLKDRIGPDVVASLARAFADVVPQFDEGRFVRSANQGLSDLELLARADHIAAALDVELPPDGRAVEALIQTLDAPLPEGEVGGLQHFIHSCWLLRRAEAADFDQMMWAAEELTQRFTSEFVIRPLIERDPERALAWLQMWQQHPNEHVRRLVSEGTRPRLPWAPRLTVFRDASAPVAELLDGLVEDPSLYVRRSVANHVGDLAKDDLPLALSLCRAWKARQSLDADWVVKHALRHPLKLGVPEVLKLFGFAGDPGWTVKSSVLPARVERGGRVTLDATLHNPKSTAQSALVDLVVHFVKANGSSSPKVFKFKTVELASGASTSLRKRLSLVDLSTRRHFSGVHRVELQINGRGVPLGAFELR